MRRGHLSFDVRVPASTANLGAGFDCLGLALDIHLKVRATVLPGKGGGSQARTRGTPGSERLGRNPGQNLILRAMQHVERREGWSLPAVRLAAHNAIPLAAGLGSSAAAIVAGVGLAFALSGREISTGAVLRHATAMEGHADNVAAALLGGLVVTATRADGSVAAVRRPWPRQIRILVVTPELTLETKAAREMLPQGVSRSAAVHNLQRSALLLGALWEGNFELLWDALQDELHQECRSAKIPGLAEILRMPRMEGLLGIALSGSGPSVVALATGRFDGIGRAIARRFEASGVGCEVRCVAASDRGLVVNEAGGRRMGGRLRVQRGNK